MSRMEKQMQLREAVTRMKIRALKQQLMGEVTKGKSQVTSDTYSTNDMIQERNHVTTESSTGNIQTPSAVEIKKNSTQAQEGTHKPDNSMSTLPRRNKLSHMNTTQLESHPSHRSRSDAHIPHALCIMDKSRESNSEESNISTQLPLGHVSLPPPPNHTPNCHMTPTPSREVSHGSSISTPICSSTYTIPTSTVLHYHSSMPHQQTAATSNHITPTRQISPDTNSHPNQTSKPQGRQSTRQSHGVTTLTLPKEINETEYMTALQKYGHEVTTLTLPKEIKETEYMTELQKHGHEVTTLTLPKEIKETEYMTALQKHKSRVNKIRRCMVAATLIQRVWREHKGLRIN